MSVAVENLAQEVVTAIWQFGLLLLAIPACISCTYLAVLTLLSARLSAHAPRDKNLRFDVIVPAHNESTVIRRVVASLLKVNWPRDRFRVIVVADNCTDDTAQLAQAAGAQVWSRSSASHKGKGYALEFAFARSREQGQADAVVVVDADSEVSENLLAAFASRIEQGAHAVQAHYGVLNPRDSWRTRLLAIAHGAFHTLRSRAREHLRVSSGIRGNGWCVTHTLLQQVPYRSFSLTEDLEYGIELGLAGYRVWYADEAWSNADMVSGAQVATTQRQRWEQGRMQLVRNKTGVLLAAGIKRANGVCLDLALDLLVLPLSYVVFNILILLVLSGALALWQPLLISWLWLSIGCGLIVTAYVLRGTQLSGMGWRGFVDLASAPLFLMWKVATMFRPKQSQEWTRTERERQ